jgi:hypothetical protein
MSTDSNKVLLDPSKAIATVEIIFSMDDWAEDASGDNGIEREDQAKKFRDAAGDALGMSMDAENRATARIAKEAGVRHIRTQDHYSDDGSALCIAFSINSLDDIKRLRAVFDCDGRAYNVEYGESSGLTLLPQGVNGPILKTASSPYQRGTDLDEWLEEQAEG